MEFSKKLTQLIERSGKSQTRLQRETGVDQSAISAMTLGKRRPYMDQAASLAKALGVSLDYLADDAADEPPTAGDQLSLDERTVLDVIRALGLEKREAIRRLAGPPQYESNRSEGQARLVSDAPRSDRGTG